MAERNNAKYYEDIYSAFAERVVKRLWVIIIILLLMIAMLGYLYIDALLSYQAEYVDMEVENGEGDAVVAGIGDVNYGESTHQGDEIP